MRSGIRLFLWLLALSGLVFCSLQGFVAVLILVILPAAVLAAICGAIALLRPSANAEADAEHTLIIFLGLCLLGFFTSNLDCRYGLHLGWDRAVEAVAGDFEQRRQQRLRNLGAVQRTQGQN